MTSLNTYNDGKWYEVVITRQQSKGTLTVNGEDQTVGEAKTKAKPNLRQMALQAPFSFGNVDGSMLEDMYLNLKLEKGTYFNGCMRNIQMAGRSLGKPKNTFGVSPCSEQIENGIFFGKGNGYVKVNMKTIFYVYIN